MINAFDILAVLTLDSSKFEKDLASNEKKASSFGGKLKNAFGVATKAGALFGGAVVAGTTAVAAMATKTANTTDHIDKMSQKIGISREAYQELDFICSQSGASVDNLRTGMKTLTNQMGKATKGTGEAADIFNKLGISVYDANGNMKDQETMLWDTLDALQGVENQTERATLANKLFGKSGSDLMPLINGARGSIHEMKEEAHNLGLVLDDETIDAGVRLTDTIDKAKRSFDAIMIKIGAQLMPIIQQVLDYILEHMPEIQEVMSVVFKYVGEFVTGVISVVKKLVDKFKEHWPAIKETVGNAIEKISEFWNTKLKPVFEAIGAFIVNVVVPAFKEKFLPAVKNAFSQIADFWETKLKPCFEAIGNFITNVLVPIFQTYFMGIILPVVKNVFNGIIDLWNNSLKPILEGIITFITGVFSGDWSKAWQGIKQIISGVWNGIKTIISTAVKNVSDVISGAWKILKNNAKEVWTNIKNTISNVWNGIKTSITTTINNIKTTITTIWNAIKTAIASVITKIASTVTDGWNNVKTAVTNAVEAIKTKVTAVWNGIKTAIESVVESIKTSITSKFETARDTVLSVFEKIKSSITNKINAARDAVKSAIDKIKSFFKFQWSLPKLKLPHISVEGSFSLTPPRVPHFSIKWYKKAMESPILLDNASIFGVRNDGTFLGGGEAGDELIIGKDSMIEMIQTAVANQMQNMMDKLDDRLAAIYGIIGEYMPNIANRQLVMDTGELVGAIIPRVDEGLGRLQDKRGRGI